MRKHLAVSLLTGMLLASGTARAGEPVKTLPPPNPPPAPTPVAEAPPAGLVPGCGATVEKSIPLREIVLREHQSATTVPVLTVREVESCRGTRTDLTIGIHEERHTAPGIELRPRETFQEVTCLTTQTENVADPATGCCHPVYRQVPVVKRVKITVYDVVPVERHYLVSTAYLKPVEVRTVTKRAVVDSTTAPAIRRTLEAIPVEGSITIQKPGCSLPCLPH